MKFSNSNKPLIFLSLSFLVPLHIYAEDVPENLLSPSPNPLEIPGLLSQKETLPNSVIDSIVNEAKKQLNVIHSTLLTFSSMISDNQVPTKNKKLLLQRLKELNFMLQRLNQEKFIQVDLGAAYFLLQLNNEVMRYFIRILNNGLNKIPQFDPSTLITRNQNDVEVDMQDIQRLMVRNNKLIPTFSKCIDNAGLRWYNHAYRAFDKIVIDPCDKYDIPRRTGVASLMAFSALTFWWYFKHDQFMKKMPKGFVRDTFFGPRPAVDRDDKILAAMMGKKSKHGSDAISFDDYGWMGKLETIAGKIWGGNFPILSAALFGAYGLVKGVKHEWNEKWPDIKKKISVWHNTLKGGIYLKQAMKDDNKFEEVYFDDIIGLDHVKDYFKTLVDYLRNPESFDRSGTTPSKGILLVGKTRTGKTYSVKALFAEITRMMKLQGHTETFKFKEFSAPEIMIMGIKNLLDEIKKHAPCVVFIDEIDLLNLQRVGDNMSLSQFLTCLSGTLDTTDPKNQIIIIGATNKPENLDFALRQPGRFGKELRYEYPSFKDRLDFLEYKLGKLSLDLSQFDLEKIARETDTKSYEALNMLLKTAVLKARLAGVGVTQKHLEETLDEELRNIITIDAREVPDHEKTIVASHMAGQALALMLHDGIVKLSKVTTKQVMTDIKEELKWMQISLAGARKPTNEPDEQRRFEYGAIFTHQEDDTIDMLNRDETINRIKFNLAGFIAEQMLVGSCGYSCHKQNMQKALYLAQTLAFEGIDPHTLPKEMQKTRFDQAFNIIETCKKEIRELFTANKQILENIAKVLEKHDTLTPEEINEIIEFTKAGKEIPALRPEVVEDDDCITIEATA